MGHRSINLVLSHADSDHTGGTGALEKSVHVASRSIPWNVSDSIDGAPKTLLRGDFLPLPSHMRGYVLHPFEPGRRNTHSLVILLVSDRTGILLTGDMEKEEEHQLVATYGRLFDLLNVRILKVAHHGSSTSSSHELVQRFKPHLALISAGVGNPFGHPHKDVIDRLHEAGTQTLATMDLGAIRLRHITSRPRIDCHARGTWQLFRQGSTC
jgi:competence protein ComEC